MGGKKLALSLDKLDALAADIKKIELANEVQGGRHLCSGLLEEADKKTLKWTQRQFILTDSCLKSFSVTDTDGKGTPETSVCIGKCKLQLVESQEELKAVVGDSIDCTGKTVCLLITTRPDKEQVLLSASSAEDRDRWVHAIRIGRTVTHANMVKLAVENRVLSDELNERQDDPKLNALAIFSNRDYIQKTPIAGGAEGWLRTSGVELKGDSADKGSIAMSAGLLSPGAGTKPKKRYCILRDSHLLVYEAGDALVNPRGIISLVSCKVAMLPDEDTEKNGFKFRVVVDTGDHIDFAASSERRRRKWAFGLKIGAHVTFESFKTLMSQHSILAKKVGDLEAKAAASIEEIKGPVDDVAAASTSMPPSASESEAVQATEELLDEDDEVQEKQRDAGAVQAFDANGNVIVRNPEGKLITPGDDNGAGNIVDETAPRYSKQGKELDAFHRPLPEGAKAMFTNDKKAVGVGPDGKHYLSNGTEVEAGTALFDRDGQALDTTTIENANKIAAVVNFDLKVKAALNRDTTDGAVDALGRTVRLGAASTKGKIINNEGEEIVPMSARRVKADGKVTEYKPETDITQTAMLQILVDDENDEGRRIGEVEIGEGDTLADVRKLITSKLDTNFADFIFLQDMSALLKYEEGTLAASNCLPEIIIRGKELKPINVKVFSAKVKAMQEEQTKKDAEKQEFDEMMQRIRAGKFLKPVKAI